MRRIRPNLEIGGIHDNGIKLTPGAVIIEEHSLI